MTAVPLADRSFERTTIDDSITLLWERHRPVDALQHLARARLGELATAYPDRRRPSSRSGESLVQN